MEPINPTVNKAIMLFRSLGKGRWSRSIRGSGAYRVRRVHPYDLVGKLSQRRGRTLTPGSQESLLRYLLRARRSPMVERKDRGIQTLCNIRGDMPMGYDLDSAPIMLWDGSFFHRFCYWTSTVLF